MNTPLAAIQQLPHLKREGLAFQSQPAALGHLDQRSDLVYQPLVPAQPGVPGLLLHYKPVQDSV
jgi:hypothetical protein